MRLEDITINLRARNAWEAMDLGVALIRRYWKAVYGPWLAMVIPFAVLLNILFQDHLWIAGLIFWWFKPFYDRIVLHVLSRAVFGNTPPVKDTVASFFSFFKTGLIAHLTLLRIDPSRSFNLPVWQLEGLRGRQRRERQKVLNMRVRSYTIWLLLTCIHLEAVLYLCLYVLIYMFIPHGIDFTPWEDLFDENAAMWTQLLANAFYIVIVSIVEPLFTAAGFTLYLNRRTQLEGWDIELSFRRMANRLQNLRDGILPGLALFLGTALTGAILTLHSPELLARESDEPAPEFLASERQAVEKSKETIEAVLKEKEFNTSRPELAWMPKRDDEEEEEKEHEPNSSLEGIDAFFSGIATAFETLFWVGLGLIVVLLIVYRDRWLHIFTGQGRSDSDYRPPEALFGMDIRPESLPDDIAGDARVLWSQGQHRMALSLLYRGALMVLVNRDKIELHESNTEGDILKLSRAHIKIAASEYLARLTGAWQSIAYAHRIPEEALALELCDRWDQHFGKRAQPGAQEVPA